MTIRRRLAWAAGPVTAMLAATVALAAPAGSLDLSFGTRGLAQLSSGYELSAVAVQRDGRVVVAGFAHRAGGVQLALARLTAGGRPDRSFNGGRPQLGPALPSGGSIGRAVAITRDGGILVAGVATDRSGTAHDGMLVERFSSSGQLDRRFAGGGAAILLPLDRHGAANALALASNGEIVVAGAGASRGSDYFDRVALARLTASGQLDQSFGAGGIRLADGAQDLGKFSTALGVALPPGGKIVIAGSRRPDLQRVQALLARFDSAGNLDRGFGQGGSYVVDPSVAVGGNIAFNALALGRGGTIVAAGAAASDLRPPAFAVAVRLSSAGVPDRSFGNGGLLLLPAERGSLAPNPVPGANAVVITRGGQTVLAGFVQDAGSVQVALWALTSRGGARLGDGRALARAIGKYVLAGANALALAPDGHLLLAGTSDDFRSRRGIVVRYLASGR